MDMNPEINKYGTKKWFDSDGLWHREDGPAIEYADGKNYWYRNGKRHQEDGPAIEGLNGYQSYWLEDMYYSEKEYWEKIKELKKCKLFKLKDEKIEWM